VVVVVVVVVVEVAETQVAETRRAMEVRGGEGGRARVEK
jgi:hypothetical protein